jgi:uroporphyrinogen decarboxylase
MNSRERVLTTLDRKEPDRPPVFATLTPQAAENLSMSLNVPYEEPIDSLLSTRISHMNLLTKLGNDFVAIAATYPEGGETKKRSDGHLVNEWGMVFKDTGLYSEFIEFPMANIKSADEVSDYPFPDPFAKGRFEMARQTSRKYFCHV